MTGQLGRDVHLARIDDDLVLLDVAKDAYFCLPGAADALVVDPDGVTLAGCDPALLSELIGAGLAFDGRSNAAGPRAAPPEPGVRDLRASMQPRPRVSDIGHMTGAALRLYRFGGRGSLQRLLRAAGEVKATGNDPGEAAASDLAMRCEQLIPWVPFKGECLWRSFLTLNVLRRAGVSVAWIFGVQTWPFRAHCWLQRGDLVLNDGAEYVGGYRPILVA